MECLECELDLLYPSHGPTRDDTRCRLGPECHHLYEVYVEVVTGETRLAELSSAIQDAARELEQVTSAVKVLMADPNDAYCLK